MTNRYRAGQPADLSHMLHRYTQCPAASSACNGPKEGDCLGFCTLHRAHPSQVERVNAMPIQFAGDEPVEPVEPVKEQKPEPGLIAGFLGIFKKEWK